MNPPYSHRHIRGQEVHCSRYLSLRRADVRKPSIQIYVLSTLDNSVVFTPLSAAPLCCATDARARPGPPQPGQTRPDHQGLCTLQDATNFRVHLRGFKESENGPQKPDCRQRLHLLHPTLARLSFDPPVAGQTSQHKIFRVSPNFCFTDTKNVKTVNFHSCS